MKQHRLGRFQPVLRIFLLDVRCEYTIAVPTSLGSTLTDGKDFFKVIYLVGKEVTAPKL